ncbi:MAG: glucosaminidase domain-containing protein [Ktedonobacteraceae bacterium]|nr:glucosaminidase domain-containing protein [Ktedonobacteraceae bacterium]
MSLSVLLLVAVLALTLPHFSLSWLGIRVQVSGAAPVSGDLSSSRIVGSPSISVVFINRVLSAYHSPAAGRGHALYDDGVHSGIDPAFALAVFLHESTFGTAGVARVTRSLGNIVCTVGYPSCMGRYRRYPTWEAGFLDFYHLLATVYLPRGLVTVEQIIPVYAPAAENDVTGYIRAVVRSMATWRAGSVEVR